jgi:pimeloyl-ACP methyl ester carboxylesterase
VVNALVAAGRRVVGLHARGHGDSDKPHDSRFLWRRPDGARRV